MAFRDGTGPNGLGPMTGRRMGRCASNAYAMPAYNAYYAPTPAQTYGYGPQYGYRGRGLFARTFGRFFGRGYYGYGRGFGRGFGAGRGRGFGMGYGRYRW